MEASEPASCEGDSAAKRPKEDQLLRLLINLLELQLWRGCGVSDCDSRLCASHLQHGEQRPGRRFSRISARATAFHIAGLNNAESFLCPRIVAGFISPDRTIAKSIETVISDLQVDLDRRAIAESFESNRDTPKPQPPPTDPKSFPQRLFTSSSVREFLGAGPNASRDHGNCVSNADNESKTPHDRNWLRIAEAKLKRDLKIYKSTGDVAFAVAALLAALGALFNSFSRAREPEKQADALELRLPLAVSLILAIGEYSLSTSTNDNRVVRSFWQVYSRTDYQGHSFIILIEMIFDRHWHGKPAILQNSIAGKALAILRTLVHQEDAWGVRFGPFQTVSLGRGSMDVVEALKTDSKAGTHERIICIAQYPWLLDTPTQISTFRRICFERMQDAVDTSKLHTRMLQKCFLPFVVESTAPPEVSSLRDAHLRKALAYYLPLHVRRESLLSDAFEDLWQRQQRELLRPIRVAIKNEGEQGVDQGGIAQEFFRLAVIEALKPIYGMFTIDERSRMAWFNPASLEPLYKFELLGVLIALGVHNGFSVPALFPGVLYRKLLGLPTSRLPQIADGWPELAKGLAQLQNWDDGDVADVFVRTFTFTVEDFGRKIHLDMTKKTSTTPLSQSSSEAESFDAPLVTNETRNDYVACYVNYLVNVTVEPQYSAFARGFHTVLPREVIGTATPETLKLLVEGPDQDVDTHALQLSTGYSNGFSPKDDYIATFWDVVHLLPQARKRQLLEFVTASDRIPVNGIGSLGFMIQKHGGGEDEERLPTSVTCFSRLLLPEYRSRDVLERKLNVALDNARGFGLS